MIKNPITRIWRSNALLGVRIIALSLLLLLVCALPLMIYVWIGDKESISMPLTLLFAGGAAISHVGFFIGMLFLIYDMLFKNKSSK